MNDIRIDVGVYTPLEIDLSEFDFTGVSKVVLTMKNMLSEGIVLNREFTSAETHTVEITPEESRLLRGDAEYDFEVVTQGGKHYKNGDNGKIILRRGCSECSG